MTPTEYAEKLRAQLDDLTLYNRPLLLAATSTVVEMASRIFVKGLATDGSKIGNYSKKDLYLSDNQIASLPNVKSTRKGKTGKNKFKDGKEHKTTWFEGWYGVREEAGRNTDKVDLSFTGDLQSEFTNSVRVNDAKPNYIDTNTYETRVTTELNVNKARGNEKHFGKEIFTVSPQEKEIFYSTAEYELKLMFE